MKELSERQKHILTMLIHEHIRSVEPVGSRLLVDQYNLDMSSATVRNELVALTEAGYLRQPHTSAGRVPTEDGYRYFVGRLMRETTLSEDMQRTITHQFSQAHSDLKQWMKLAASVLATQSRAASLITAPQPDEVRFKHLELIATHGRQALAVLVLEGGQISQRFITLDEPASQEILTASAQRVTSALLGKDRDAVLKAASMPDVLDAQLENWVKEQMQLASGSSGGEIILDGLTNVLAEPEFAQSDEARRALHLLEERSLLQDLLSNTALGAANSDGVQVLIGGEGAWDDLRQCSVILSRYGTPGIATGTLGVIGPMRMSYAHSISLVRFLSSLMSEFVAEQW